MLISLFALSVFNVIVYVIYFIGVVQSDNVSTTLSVIVSIIFVRILYNYTDIGIPFTMLQFKSIYQFTDSLGYYDLSMYPLIIRTVNFVFKSNIYAGNEVF